MGRYLGTKGAAGEPSPHLCDVYRLSTASRFWQIAPWELEARPDALFWIAKAIQITEAENLAQEIMMDAAKVRNGQTGKQA